MKISSTPIESLSAKYEKIIRQTDGEVSVNNGEIVKTQVCHRYIFSDSLFLIAKEDSEDSFTDLISYAWRMMQLFLACGFPLRGAVTYGDIYANLDNHVFLGKAISDAVLLEGSQNWIGAVVEDAAIDRYRKVLEIGCIQNAVMNVLLPIYNVPLKDGTKRDYHVINWRENMISQDGIKALFKNDPPDKSAQIKIENALRFSREVVESGYSLLDDEKIPERYRKLFVGNGIPSNNGPMFQNGDEY